MRSRSRVVSSKARSLRPRMFRRSHQLPSREELISKLVFLLQSPISGFAKVLGAIPRQFVIAMDQIRQQKEGSE